MCIIFFKLFLHIKELKYAQLVNFSVQKPKIQRNRWSYRINIADSQLLTSLISKGSINEFSFAYKVIWMQKKLQNKLPDQ